MAAKESSGILQNKSAYLVQVVKVRPLYLGPCCCERSQVLCTAEVKPAANNRAAGLPLLAALLAQTWHISDVVGNMPFIETSRWSHAEHAVLLAAACYPGLKNAFQHASCYRHSVLRDPGLLQP